MMFLVSSALEHGKIKLKIIGVIMNVEVISNNEIIELSTDSTVINVSTESNIVEVAGGVIPIQGEQGEPGVSFDSIEFIFASPSLEWIINHNKGYKPSIVIQDVFGYRYYPNITDVNENTAIVSFEIPFSGIAIVN